MARTKHIHQRMTQRGITSRRVDLTARFGMDHGDKIILNRKNTKRLLSEMDRFRKGLLDIHAKGGLVVVEENDAQITTYPLTSYTRKKAEGHHAH